MMIMGVSLKHKWLVVWDETELPTQCQQGPGRWQNSDTEQGAKSAGRTALQRVGATQLSQLLPQ